jgi:tRNA modification GTPase
VEALGIARTRKVLDAADIVLDLRPLAAIGTCSDESITAPNGSTLLAVWTKSDQVNGQMSDEGEVSGFVTSSLTGHGLPELRQAMLEAARGDGLADAAARGVVLNERHRDRLLACREALDQVLGAVAAGDDVVASMLAVSLQELGAISGRVFTEQILGAVFGRFCVGK